MMQSKYETKNLILTVLTRADSRLVYNFYYDNLRDFGKYEPINYDVASTLRYYSALLDAEQNMISEGNLIRYYFLEKRSPFNIVGTASFRKFERSEHIRSCILGYKIAPSFRRKGYAYEALSLLCPLVIENESIHRINAYVMTQNPASYKLLEKLGFSREGILRRSLMLNGEWNDEYAYSLLEDEI